MTTLFALYSTIVVAQLNARASHTNAHFPSLFLGADRVSPTLTQSTDDDRTGDDGAGIKLLDFRDGTGLRRQQAIRGTHE